MANRNKIKGSRYELKIVKELNDKGYKVGTSRLLSKYMDDKKVDIVDYPDSQTPLPIYIQCKSITNCLNFHDIFNEFELKEKPLVIFNEKTEKRGKKFMKVGEYVIMEKKLFYELCLGNPVSVSV